MVAVDYWTESMNTLSMVAITVPLSVAIGFGVGVIAFKFPRAERVIIPALDFLQTVPTFAYLIPVLKLFGFGPVAGLVTSLLYAFPPINTLLGLKQVPSEVVESALMSGATPRQLFWLAQVPSAQRQILLGVNQTTMAALSMVIIASIIGGTQDIGWEVLSTMRKADFGASLLAGIVIAIIAVIMDRVTWGLATRDMPAQRSFHRRHAHMIASVVAIAIILVLARYYPFTGMSSEWSNATVKWVNDATNNFIRDFKSVIDLVKTGAFFYVILPLKVGLDATVKPGTWGFDWQIAHSIGYWVLAAGAAIYAARAWSLAGAIALIIVASVFHFGIINLPWLGLAALIAALAYAAGGRKLAIGTAIGLLFILASGIWEYAVLSIHLCGLAVAFSFLLGTTLGIWAAHSDRVSAVLRPINDTLQTMPLFVLLIPIVMIFRVGDFTALLAICLYAVVPAQRYAENALRSLPTHVIEAATAMGCTTRQLLFRVKLPLALPGMMLGLNQTIMYGISMLVITALVGTKDLGQQVYVGLSDGDFGVGFVAGLGMAVIAMIADRMTQAWSRRQRENLGIA
jgi:glycine betaine/proline transport system permease protein